MKLYLVLLSNDPKRVYPALMLSLAAAAMKDDVYLYCAMDGLDLGHKERRKSIQLEGAPPADKLYKDALALGVRVCACAPSREMLTQMGITESVVDKGVRLEDVTGFLLDLKKDVGDGTLLTFI
ncbi:MAG: DsrE family protein [Candidatus Freyarchaeota archaeon]|nr:DsrE family protein [Candidatus Jordarchaeia archaeon]